MSLRRPFLLAFTPLLLTGCVAAAVGAGTEAGVSLAEERSLGTKVDDVSIYADINRLFLRTDNSDLFAGVTVDVRHARVLLTGNVNKEATAQKAVELAWQARGVEEVINEISVSPGSGFMNATNDALIKKNVEARILITKEVWVINYSINVVNGTVYLLGRVHNQGELDRVLNIVRATRGVKRVVNYLQIRPQNDPVHPANPYSAAPASPAASTSSTPTYNAAPSAPVNPAPVVPASSGTSGMGGDGYAAPELIQSNDIR